MKAPQTGLQQGSPYGASDPHQLAAKFLDKHGRDPHRHLALRFWRDEFWTFREGYYTKLSERDLRAKLTDFVAEEFRRINLVTVDKKVMQVTTGLVSNVMQALTGKVHVESQVEQPVWLGKYPAGPYFVFRNGLVSVESLLAGGRPGATPHCSNWFSQATFPYNFEPAATCQGWLVFLNEVLEGDRERIALLQQWFGYCLTPDTTQQRFIAAKGECGAPTVTPPAAGWRR